MIQPGTAAETVRNFFDAYLVQRNAERTLAFLTEDIHWIGTGRSEQACGREQTRQALLSEFAQAPDPNRIEYDDIKETILSERCAAVLLTANVYPAAEGAEDIWFRVTAGCKLEEDGVCRIASIHASTPDKGQEEGEFFPSSSLERGELERRLESRSLELMGESIPGGILGIYLEPGLPLYYVNDFILSYLGYTYEEFVAFTEGKVVNCIHPDDRKQVDELLRKSGPPGENGELQYRMRKKDGGYIWVCDVNKRGISVEGREVCIGALRDISTEIEVRERLKRQAEEQKRQAKRYDHLLQSVLCGIVQYRMDGREVNFKNANREAIRIFGYEPEEFWAKKDWDFFSLVAEEDLDSVVREVSGLREIGDKSDFEYRLLKKDGTPCWIIGGAEVILDSDGEKLLQSVFLDIDDRKKTELKNRRLSAQVEASNELLHLALEHTTTCEFYYYPRTSVCIVPERTRVNFRCRSHYDNMPLSFAVEQVEEACWPVFYEMYERIHRGEKTASCVFHTKDGSFWLRETLSVISSGEDGSPHLVVGIVEDITHQKEMERALEETRTRDSLTGLYNKESGIRRVQEYIEHGRKPGEHCVLMLLDMDDLKEINHKEGRIFTDVILQETADILRAETGPDNIQIRLGGDEFMLLIKDCDKKNALEIGPRIANQVKHIITHSEKDIHISVSIGMCSTEVTEDYNSLYRCVESTLKYVKEHGKGQAACYLDTSNELGVFLTQIYTEEHSVSAIDQEIVYQKTDLVSFALDLLGKAKNLNDAVFLLLSRIGKTYHFDRVSILEADSAYLSYRFTYQWAKNRADLQLGQEFYASAEDFEVCSNMYDEEGLSDRNIREGISHIASCLHAGIWNYGEYAGSMSFEVNQKDYQWTKEQRKLLKELVKVVPSFIMKSKADAVSKAKTDFLSRMSHEIRTPMNAISGMTTIAKSVLDDRKKTLECLEKIESANTYLLELINDILDMSRIESGKLELSCGPMDLGRQLEALEALFRSQALGKGLELYFENGYRENRPLQADSLRLNQVLVNIIGNAVKFTDRGRITVRVEEIKAAPQAVLRFSVSDTGIGIEAAAITRIFNAFEQAEPSAPNRRPGTGLGLSISSRLVQMMGGTLEVKSRVGEGSEFFFTVAFDYAPEGAPAPVEPALSSPKPDFSGRHVLLAEDNELNREIAQTILEMNGFTVVCAGNGKEALEIYCEGKGGPFDVILMDIRMPVMDGLESARRIRTSGRPDARTIPIIALTANAFDEDTKKSMDSGMNGHLSKPLQVEQLLGLLAQCMSRRNG